MTDPRAAFEAAMRERGWEDYELKREKDGYGDHDARLAWSVWQAAIKRERDGCAKACEEVLKAGDVFKDYEDNHEDGHTDGCNNCAAAIRARLDG